MGRGAYNQVQLSSPSVSSQHCKFTLEANGDICLVDFSTNGTMLNGVRLKKVCMLKRVSWFVLKKIAG